MTQFQLPKRTEFGTVKEAFFHDLARPIVSAFPAAIKREFGHLLFKLQMGDRLGMPFSRSMRSLFPGSHELRLRGEDGNYRFFYFLKSEKGIFIFHAFMKKDKKTSKLDLELGKKRLLEMLRKYDQEV